MNRSKLIAVAIVLALILFIGGMLAYFTDTDETTNVFTLGDNVDITLTEQWTAGDGLGLHPGAVVTKAPTINNVSTTTPAYVFAEVTIPCYDSNADGDVDTPLFTFLDSSGNDGVNSGWTRIDSNTPNTTSKTVKYVYAYGTSSAMTELAQSTSTSTPVFSQVVLAPTLTQAQKATAPSTPNIVVKAYGIQIDNLGVTTPSAIFGLFGNS